MVLEKKTLSLDELESQSALVLPDRELMAPVGQLGLINVVITNLLNDLSVDVDVRNIAVAVQVCAVVELISAEILTVDVLQCEIRNQA